MTSTPIDIARIGRSLIRFLLTVGAAVTFFYLVASVCIDVWIGDETVSVSNVYSAVTISLSITFGSAFVGWLGLSGTGTGTTVQVKMKEDSRGEEHERWSTAIWPFLKKVATSLSGAALFAMILYLIAGALAGVTYVVKEGDTPGMLITVATAWAAQASAIIAATLAITLRSEE